ncbi:glycoside hydrolase family 16 protein [Mucilaginibacter conchicola]|nr:glycoside hydrolase family 16 protein [Mucilaginibacter conchicola]
MKHIKILQLLSLMFLLPALQREAKCQDKTIQWSGYTWTVKDHNEPIGPGPNYWSPKNVWVDKSGWLHLRVSKNAATGKWECAEVASNEKFGLGTYQWQIDADVDKFDDNLVLGLFDYSGVDARDEIDIELARWGNSGYPNLNYTVYPKQDDPPRHTAYATEFTSPNGTYTTHKFIRTANSVTFKTLYGHLNDEPRDNLFMEKVFKSPSVSVSTIDMPVLMNLWLFKGEGLKEGNSFEVVIHSFKFQPGK